MRYDFCLTFFLSELSRHENLGCATSRPSGLSRFSVLSPSTPTRAEAARFTKIIKNTTQRHRLPKQPDPLVTENPGNI